MLQLNRIELNFTEIDLPFEVVELHGVAD